MAGSVNKVILIGNLGKDPEIRVLENGVKLARFTLATSETYTDKATGEKRSITDWHNIVLWRGLADIAERFLTKGKKVYVEGKLKTRSWQDEQGNNRFSTEIIGDNLTMLTNRGENQEMSPNTPPDFTQKEETKGHTPLDQDLLEDDDDGLPF